MKIEYWEVLTAKILAISLKNKAIINKSTLTNNNNHLHWQLVDDNFIFLSYSLDNEHICPYIMEDKLFSL